MSIPDFPEIFAASDNRLWIKVASRAEGRSLSWQLRLDEFTPGAALPASALSILGKPRPDASAMPVAGGTPARMPTLLMCNAGASGEAVARSNDGRLLCDAEIQEHQLPPIDHWN